MRIIRFFSTVMVMMVCLLGVTRTHPAHAQSPLPTAVDRVSTTPPPLTVGLYVRPPFSVKNEERYSGMAVELWEAAAARLGLKYSYKLFDNISDVLQAATNGEIDVVVSNVTISSARLKHLDFTQPWYDSGLRIMIKENRSANIFAKLAENGYLQTYMWLAGLLLVATFILTLVDRRFDAFFPRTWKRGLAESFFHVISATSTGKTTHKLLFGAFGRIFSALWILCGIAFVAYITSSITSTMVGTSMTHSINNRTDLAKKIVGVQSGSVAETHAQLLALDIRRFRNTTEATEALLDERIDAIIDDAPVLEYYDTLHPELPLTVVGGIIKPEKYGFALPPGSKLTAPLSVQLLELHESGLLDNLYAKYFGATR